MIVDIEKLKQHRTILAAHMYTLHDGLSEEACEFVVKLLDEVILDLEQSGESIIELNREGGKT